MHPPLDCASCSFEKVNRLLARTRSKGNHRLSPHHHRLQFTDGYRAPSRSDVCVLPGKTERVPAARAICGGTVVGVQTWPIATVDQGIVVGDLQVWKALSGSVYFTMTLDCALDGTVVSEERSPWHCHSH
jgi:hypothetical protein